MSEKTPLLSLPYIQAAQAQKHVTHNEAIELLDAVTQISLEAVDATTPPTSAAEGQAWAMGLTPTGAWAGHGGEIAAWRGGGWLFITPHTGWVAWDKTAMTLVVFDGTTWVQTGGAPDLQNLDGLGVNASFDVTNKLAVAADATLLTHNGAGHQLKINKATEADTASLLYQTNWSGRAEMGLNGTNDFSVKVSPDGSTFTEALRIDATTGAVDLPATPVRQIMPYDYHQYLLSSNAWTAPSPNAGQKVASTDLGTDPEPTLNWAIRGIFLPAGSTLHSLVLAGYINSDEISGLDLRCYFQSGSWNNAWNNSASTLRDTLFSQNSGPNFFGAFMMQRQYIPLSYTTRADGHFFIAARASQTSTVTATRFFYTSGALDVSYMPPSA